MRSQHVLQVTLSAHFHCFRWQKPVQSKGWCWVALRRT